jgi:hypothetical protein
MGGFRSLDLIIHRVREVAVHHDDLCDINAPLTCTIKMDVRHVPRIRGRCWLTRGHVTARFQEAMPR